MANNDDELMMATESFVTEIDGQEHTVHAHRTRVRRGHPLHKARPDSFEVVDRGPGSPETASRGPGEKRGAQPGPSST